MATVVLELPQSQDEKRGMMSEPIVRADRSVSLTFHTSDAELARSMSGTYTAYAEAFKEGDGSWLVELTFRPQVDTQQDETT